MIATSSSYRRHWLAWRWLRYPLLSQSSPQMRTVRLPSVDVK